MSRILHFPHQARPAVTANEPDTEALVAILDSATEAVRNALDLLDQMQAKTEQMHRMLPARLVPDFEDQQLDISRKIGLIRSEVASVSIVSKILKDDKK